MTLHSCPCLNQAPPLREICHPVIKGLWYPTALTLDFSNREESYYGAWSLCFDNVLWQHSINSLYTCTSKVCWMLNPVNCVSALFVIGKRSPFIWYTKNKKDAWPNSACARACVCVGRGDRNPVLHLPYS